MQKLEKTVEKQLGLENRNDYELFALVPLSKSDLYENIKKYNNPEIAIRLNDSSKYDLFLYLFYFFRPISAHHGGYARLQGKVPALDVEK